MLRKTRIGYRYTHNEKQTIRNNINITIEKYGVIVSKATTVRDICNASNYNRTIELPLYDTKKIQWNK